jgi:murein L,D-transpeptidase YafK
MQLMQDGKTVRTYKIALGFTPEGDKLRQGDGKTPEGEFTIDRRNAESAFHLSLGLDYPQPEDRARAAKAGYSPGGDIFIHGQPNALPDGLKIKGDWTAGCIAVTNAEIEEIWAVTPIGTKVEVRPDRSSMPPTSALLAMPADEKPKANEEVARPHAFGR